MEILAVEPIMTLGTFSGITFLVGIIIAIIFAIACSSKNDAFITITGIFLAVIVVTFLISINFPVESGNYKYTVEITDNTKYQELIEDGYKFTRVYDNKAIYEIKGAPLEGIEK